MINLTIKCIKWFKRVGDLNGISKKDWFKYNNAYNTFY